jgi:hypothetical protein
MDTIERIVNQDKTIYTAIYNTISTMKDGTNVSIDDLTRTVNNTINMDFNALKPFVSHFARSVEEDGIGYVAPGRFGGFRKGLRPTSKKDTQ